MTLEDVVAARRSVRRFTTARVPMGDVRRAVTLAVQAPAPHHSSPWRFLLLEAPGDKTRLSRAMGAVWASDLRADGVADTKVEAILARSHELLTQAPLVVVCLADTTRAHPYPDARRQRAEWSLYAHSVGAAVQTFMLALTERGIASCWLSAPVFCGDAVRNTFALPRALEPHALVLAGYASPDYRPRPRPSPQTDAYLIES